VVIGFIINDFFVYAGFGLCTGHWTGVGIGYINREIKLYFMRRCQECGRMVLGRFKRCIDCHNIVKDRLESLKHEYLKREFAVY